MVGAAGGMLRGFGIRLPRFCVPIKPSVFGQLRLVHNTAKKDHTSLMTSDLKHSAFHKMSLNALKSECRVRGLKVSGKKAELVDRITSCEGRSKPAQKRKISTKPPSNAKPKLKEAVPKQLFDTTNENGSTIPRSVFTMKTPSPTEQAPRPTGEVLKSGNATGTKAAEMMNMSGTAANAKAAERGTLSDTIAVEEQLTLKDKLFLLGFGTIAALWWGSQSRDEAQV